MGALNVPTPMLNPMTQPTMVTVTTMSEPKLEPWSSLWDTNHPMNPSTMPAMRPVRAFCLR
jgi:hypothetical protein